LHRNISTRSACIEKIKTLLLCNSYPSYRLILFRIWSVQSFFRYKNLRCSHLAGSRKDTR